MRITSCAERKHADRKREQSDRGKSPSLSVLSYYCPIACWRRVQYNLGSEEVALMRNLVAEIVWS